MQRNGFIAAAWGVAVVLICFLALSGLVLAWIRVGCHGVGGCEAFSSVIFSPFIALFLVLAVATGLVVSHKVYRRRRGLDAIRRDSAPPPPRPPQTLTGRPGTA